MCFSAIGCRLRKRIAAAISPTDRWSSSAPNLTGAKYTLAVPAYAYAAGLRDFSDIRRFAPALSNSIYGIEPGNDGNRVLLKMLQGQSIRSSVIFKLIESSEQGMLAQVERAYRAKQPIVFLAWEPHR